MRLGIHLGLILAIVIILGVSHGANAQSKQYWIVGEDATQVWSLSDNQFVDITNPDYTAWLILPGSSTAKIPDTTSLYTVIAATYPDHLAASAPVLEANGGLSPLQSFTWRRAAGIIITYTGQPSLYGRYSLDDPNLGWLMLGALLSCEGTTLANCATPFPFGATHTYLDMDFVPHTMSVTQMRVIALAVRDAAAALYEQLKIGQAGGTPAWPSLLKTVP